MPVKFLAPLPGSFCKSVNIDNSLLKYYFRQFLLLFLMNYLFILNTFYLIKNSIDGFCSVSGSFRHFYA